MKVKKQKLELDMEQWIGSNLRKKYAKPVYHYPIYLTCRVYHAKCKAG